MQRRTVATAGVLACFWAHEAGATGGTSCEVAAGVYEVRIVRDGSGGGVRYADDCGKHRVFPAAPGGVVTFQFTNLTGRDDLAVTVQDFTCASDHSVICPGATFSPSAGLMGCAGRTRLATGSTITVTINRDVATLPDYGYCRDGFLESGDDVFDFAFAIVPPAGVPIRVDPQLEIDRDWSLRFKLLMAGLLAAALAVLYAMWRAARSYRRPA